MTNITKEFTYDQTDDQYSQTNEDLTTATLTYSGPAYKYVVFDSTTNKMVNATIPEEQWDNGEFNNQDDGQYAVRIDCNEETLICALLPADGNFDIDTLSTVSEEVPGSAIPYVRNDPMLPDHVYEVTEIVYNPDTETFVKPFPWKAPIMDWGTIINYRNNLLNNADRSLSEDLPESVYNKVAKFKKYLRNLPTTCGAAWDITLDNAGSGYVVGDNILLSDPVFKNNTNAADILLTVSEVDDSGAITAFTSSSKHCYNYHKEAGSYTDVFYTSNSSNGSGATIDMSKIATVAPHKITIIRNPIENVDRVDGHSSALDNLPD